MEIKITCSVIGMIFGSLGIVIYSGALLNGLCVGPIVGLLAGLLVGIIVGWLVNEKTPPGPDNKSTPS